MPPIRGKNMSGATISLEDRQEIYDVLARYVWSMDTGDIAGVVATFTLDGVVKDVTGKRWVLPRVAPEDLRRISSRVPTGVVDSITSSIFLWRKPKGKATASPRTGSLSHGTLRETTNPFAP